MHTPPHKAIDFTKATVKPAELSVPHDGAGMALDGMKIGCVHPAMLPNGGVFGPINEEIDYSKFPLPSLHELINRGDVHGRMPDDHPYAKDPNFVPSKEAMRGFESGATRTNDAGRIDPEGFISPTVLLRFCEYMNRNRVQADGNIRASDNWQKGIPIEAYRKSIQRHDLELWAMTRDANYKHPENKSIEDVLCALMFNVMGMLHETLKAR